MTRTARPMTTAWRAWTSLSSLQKSLGEAHGDAVEQVASPPASASAGAAGEGVLAEGAGLQEEGSTCQACSGAWASSSRRCNKPWQPQPRRHPELRHLQRQRQAQRHSQQRRQQWWSTRWQALLRVPERLDPLRRLRLGSACRRCRLRAWWTWHCQERLLPRRRWQQRRSRQSKQLDRRRAASRTHCGEHDCDSLAPMLASALAALGTRRRSPPLSGSMHRACSTQAACSSRLRMLQPECERAISAAKHPRQRPSSVPPALRPQRLCTRLAGRQRLLCLALTQQLGRRHHNRPPRPRRRRRPQLRLVDFRRCTGRAPSPLMAFGPQLRSPVRQWPCCAHKAGKRRVRQVLVRLQRQLLCSAGAGGQGTVLGRLPPVVRWAAAARGTWPSCAALWGRSRRCARWEWTWSRC